jgi:rod shape determining protein RodA
MRGLAQFGRNEISFARRLWQLHWLFVLLICAIAAIGFAMLYSAAGGSFDPWASRQMVRFAFGILIMLGLAIIDVRVWFRYAYPIYFAVFILLLAVEIMGDIGMGARRWLDLKVINVQPSEVMKIAMMLVLARYFHGLNQDQIGHPLKLAVPALLVLAPAALIIRQPDLGTALMIVFASTAVFFAAGVPRWVFVTAVAGAVAVVPIAWQFLHGYQQKRVLTFLDPERDPLGAGYHIIQSKIALGSGGLSGRGFLQGSQSHLSFLPEKQTDFIFTMLAEEFGLIGGVCLMALYMIVIAYGIAVSTRARSQFARLMALGLTTTVFLYVFINMAMVMGIIPVVGVPLPLVSYGGTAMITVMVGLGLIMGAYVHRDVTIGRTGGAAED